MDWSNESYVRLYTRDTTSWRRLGWDGQNVLMQLLRKVDRAGTIELDGLDPWEAVVLHCGAPEDAARRGMEAILRVGVVEQRDGLLVFPKFIPAQECSKSDKLRAKESRMKKARGEPDSSQTVTAPSRDVTPASQTDRPRHVPSHAVTPRHSLLCSADPLLRNASGEREDAGPAVELLQVAADLVPDNSQTDRRLSGPVPQVATTGLGQQVFEAYRAESFARELTPESAGSDQKLRIAQRVCDHAALRKVPLKAACAAVIAQAFDDAAATDGKVILALERCEVGKPKRGYKPGTVPAAKGIDVMAARRAIGVHYVPKEGE